MILVSEVVHPGEVHFEFNSSLLEVISYIDPAEQIIFRAEDDQVKAVRNNTKTADRIAFLSFGKYYDPKGFSWLKRISGEIKQIYKSLKQGKKVNAHTYIWTCLFPTGHFFLSIYLLLFNKRAKHIVVLHGELEFLKTANRRKSEIYLGKILKLAIVNSPKNVKYIVLGDRIKEHLESYIPGISPERIIAILHPYHYSSDNERQAFQAHSKPIIFGSVGTQMLSKNSNWIFKLAESLEEDIRNEDIAFITIGKVLPEIDPFKSSLVKQLYSTAFVPQQIFEAESKKINFVLFFYDDNSYQLCASGAIFEVIKLGLPVISIYNDYFDWLFKKYGQMGFLCKNLDEMKLLIKQIEAGSLNAEIDNISKTMKHFKMQNNLPQMAADLSGKL